MARWRGGHCEASRSGAFGPGRGPDAHLGREEELELVRRAAIGDAHALDRLVQAHFPLAVMSARAFQGRGAQLDDLVAEACVGLLEAVGRFDPDRGFRFMTYAIWWVRRRLAQAVIAAPSVRIPRRHHRVGPSVAGRHGVAPARFMVVSLSGPTGDALADTLQQEAGLVDEVARGQAAHSIERALAGLSDRQRSVIGLRYGLQDGDERTLQSIATAWGVSKERVRQIEAGALARLRAALRPSGPRASKGAAALTPRGGAARPAAARALRRSRRWT